MVCVYKDLKMASVKRQACKVDFEPNAMSRTIECGDFNNNKSKVYKWRKFKDDLQQVKKTKPNRVSEESSFRLMCPVVRCALCMKIDEFNDIAPYNPDVD